MEHSVKAALVKDISNYLSEDTEMWYKQRGVPYRRDYLFHGPPGTGKTTLSLAIAGRFGLEVHVLSLSDPKLDDALLAKHLSFFSARDLLLLEDIDSVGLTREFAASAVNTIDDLETDGKESDNNEPLSNFRGVAAEQDNGRVTLSGLLNALDGAGSSEGHVLIMSTNAPGALDPALVPAGRVDYEVEFEYATQAVTEEIFIRMMSKKGRLDVESRAQTFARSIPEGQFTPADIQGYLLLHSRDIEGALDGVGPWVSKTMSKRKGKKLARGITIPPEEIEA